MDNRDCAIVYQAVTGEWEIKPKDIPEHLIKQTGKILSKLTPAERDFLLLHYRDGLTYKQIAHKCGTYTDIVKRTLARALKRIELYLLDKSGFVTEYGLSARARHCLTRNGIATKNELMHRVEETGGPDFLLDFRNLGNKTYLEICHAFGLLEDENERTHPKVKTHISSQ